MGLINEILAVKGVCMMMDEPVASRDKREESDEPLE